MKKKTYSKPVLVAERFEPQEYCVVCFSYQAELLCDIARQGGPGTSFNDGAGMPHQYNSCGTSFVTVTFVDGVVNYDGYESYNYDDTHQGAKVDLHDVVIPGIYDIDPTAGPLPTIEGATWQSTFMNRTWNHHGPAVIKSYEMIDRTRPNMS